MSKVLQRSGVAIYNMANLLEWSPTLVIQVGIGINHQETDVITEAWPQCKFIGFEPVPGNAENYPGEVVPMAISDVEGFAAFHVKERHHDGSSLFPPREGKKVTQRTCTVTTLDTFFRDRSVADEHVLLWLDCEGSELTALRGAKELLTRVSVINIEMTSKPPNPEWPDPYDIHMHLARAGFVRQSVHTNRSSAGQCDCIYVTRSLFRPEYCCCPCWRLTDDQKARETEAAIQRARRDQFVRGACPPLYLEKNE